MSQRDVPMLSKSLLLAGSHSVSVEYYEEICTT